VRRTSRGFPWLSIPTGLLGLSLNKGVPYGALVMNGVPLLLDGAFLVLTGA
jgi:hypothetical protein